MTLTPIELADLMQKLATASKTMAEAEQQRADSDKARAEADKVRADIEKERAETKESELLTQNKLDVAAADLNAKTIANQKARSEADAARIDKLIEQFSGAVPDLSSLGKSTVTFGEGKALRQGEAIALALASVADQISSDVRTALGPQGPTTVFVTSETRVVAALASYWQLRDEADLLSNKLIEAAGAAETALDEDEQGNEMALVPGAGVVAAAVASKAITQVASLFELEVAVTTSAADIPANAVQAAVIQRLCDPEKVPTISIKHQWARIREANSSLQAVVSKLIDRDIATAKVDARLQTRIKELGDRGATVAEATKDASNTTTQPDKGKSVARDDAKRLTTLKAAQDNLGAVAAKARAFALGGWANLR